MFCLHCHRTGTSPSPHPRGGFKADVTRAPEYPLNKNTEHLWRASDFLKHWGIVNLVAPSISKDILLKGKMKQVCDEIVFFAVSFGILYFHKRLGQALNCSSFFVTNFHSSYHQGSLTSQFPKLEKAHKLQVPPTMAFSRLK